MLVYMDDTVLLATTRDNIIKKFRILWESCEEYRMKVNECKIFFLWLTVKQGDAEPVYVNGCIIVTVMFTLDLPSLADLIRQKQHTFYQSMGTEIRDMIDDPLAFSLRHVISLNTVRAV